MGFRQGAYAKVWSVENKGNYSVGNVSISRKNKNSNLYETEFQDGYVRFVGDGHEAIKGLQIPNGGISIRITSCDVTHRYDAEKKRAYTNFVIFGLDVIDDNSRGNRTNKNSSNTNKSKKAYVPEESSDENPLPF